MLTVFDWKLPCPSNPPTHSSELSPFPREASMRVVLPAAAPPTWNLLSLASQGLILSTNGLLAGLLDMACAFTTARLRGAVRPNQHQIWPQAVSGGDLKRLRPSLAKHNRAGLT